MLTILTGLSAEAGVIQDRSSVLVLCGLKDLAAMETKIPADCAGIIGFSVVGGLVPGVKVGDICLADSVITADLHAHVPDYVWNKQLMALLSKGGSGATFRRFFSDAASLADTPAKRADLAQRTSAAVVDMGTYAIASWAERHGKPFVTIGTISDAWDQVVTGNPAIMNADGSPNIAEILREAKGDPKLFSTLMQETHTFIRAIWALRTVYHLVAPSWGFQ